MFKYTKGRKGRGRDRVAVCRICGKRRLHCLAKKQNGVYCKNPPKMCGYCATHCKMREGIE